ncbi:MAG: YIP1 family protein [Hyphomicrobiales bacterium]
MDPNAVLNRVGRLARLDTTVFDEVRDDPNETLPAVIIAAISAFLAGLGAFLWWKVVPDLGSDPENLFVNTFILGSIFLLVLFGVAALVVYVVMAQMYKTQADLQSLIRVLGYASIPLAASLLMFIPFVWPVFALVPLAVLLVMMIYAVQSATGADSTQVVIASVIGLAVLVLVCGIIATASDDAPMGAGIFGVLVDFN